MRQIVGFLALSAALALASPSASAVQQTVARAQFTSWVQDREPVDELASIDRNVEEIFFFTEFRNMAGQFVTHRWTLNGQVMTEVSFRIRASRWRIYSRKHLQTYWIGSWTVDVIDENDNVLVSKTIEYSDQLGPRAFRPRHSPDRPQD